MLLLRPIEQSDLPSLKAIAKQSGYGFTSLPEDERLLSNKIARSSHTFNSPNLDNGYYLFVLEDLATNNVVGTCGIDAAVGKQDAFYHYRLSKEVYHSQKLNVHNEVDTLTLCNDYTGLTELCSLYLNPDYRSGSNGKLLSKSRFLFIANHRRYFSNRVFAEMRGVSDDTGQSPFYLWLQTYFFSIDFPQADFLSGVGQKEFMAELMPRSPIYTCLLPESAQEVIAKVHQHTEGAKALLEHEGFRFRGYVDVFDAGPTLECETDEIDAIKRSHQRAVTVGKVATEGAILALVTNTKYQDFRALVATVILGENAVTIAPECAQALMVKGNDLVRILQLKE